MADKKIKWFWTNLNKPKDGKVKDGKIEIKVGGQTHVFKKDAEDDKVTANAPFYFRKVTGDFECTVKITSKTKMDCWLDQCGIMFQEKRGIYAKLALEFQKPPREENNKYYVAAYVHSADTLEKEVESKTPYPGQSSTGDKNYAYVQLEDDQEKNLWLRMSRLAGFIEAEYSFVGGADESNWTQLKAQRFSDAEQFSVGLFASSPLADHDGFKAVLSDFDIEATIYVDDDDEEGGGEGAVPAEEVAAANEKDDSE